MHVVAPLITGPVTKSQHTAKETASKLSRSAAKAMNILQIIRQRD